jgi:CubicO group peptidase (beta-lactamase class C family)
MTPLRGLVLCFALTGLSIRPVHAQESLRLGVDSILAQYDHANGPGCAVGIDRGGQSVLTKGYGMADLEHHVALDSASVFHAASLSKQFTAMAALLLSQEGKLDLDRGLGTYLPDLPAPMSRVTIRQALQHVGGLRDQWELLAAAGWRLGDDLVTDDDVLGLVRRQRALNFAPGAEFLYSNTGFTLVARIIAKQSGMSFPAYVAARIFTPVGMSSSRFDDSHGSIVPRRAVGHAEQDDGSWRLRSPNYSTMGATGLLTTVVDLLLWGRNFDSKQVGGESAVAALTTSAVLVGGDSTHYGLGIGLDPLGIHRAFGHSGSDPGFTGYFLHLPSERISVALLCNVGEVPTAYLARRIARRVLEEQAPRVASLPWRAETDSSKLGWYWNREREQFWSIEADSGRLLAADNGSLIQLRLRSIEGNHYRVGDGPRSLDFSPSAAADMKEYDAPSPPNVIAYRHFAAWKPSKAALRALVGRYRSDEIGTDYSLELTGDTLLLRRPKQADARLRPAFVDAFVGNGFILRIDRRAGRPAALIVSRPRLRALRFARVP